MNLFQKKVLRQKRIWRVRRKVKGTAERPRLCVHFSNKHIYAQAIDDASGRSLLYVSSLDKEVRGDNVSANKAGAERMGGLFAKRAVDAGIQSVVFDRNGRLYHGTVKTFADAARAGGLQF